MSIWSYHNSKAQEAEMGLLDTLRRFADAVKERDTGLARRLQLRLTTDTVEWADATESAKATQERDSEGSGNSDYRA